MDQKRKVLLDLINRLPKEYYTLEPEQNTWSIGQIVNHLYLSELSSLLYLKKKLLYPETIPPFNIKSWWSTFFVIFILWSPFKVKAPVKINMWGDQEVLSPGDLEHKWNLVRSELASFISENQQAFGSHLVFNHPFSGRMTMHQMLIFLNHHIAHHMRQVRRIKKILAVQTF